MNFNANLVQYPHSIPYWLPWRYHGPSVLRIYRIYKYTLSLLILFITSIPLLNIGCYVLVSEEAVGGGAGPGAGEAGVLSVGERQGIGVQQLCHIPC